MNRDRMYREFDFGQDRPGDSAVRDTIRTALEDENLRLGAFGASAHFRTVILRDGRMVVRVPLHMIEEPPLSEAELYKGYRNALVDAAARDDPGEANEPPLCSCCHDAYCYTQGLCPWCIEACGATTHVPFREEV